MTTLAALLALTATAAAPPAPSAEAAVARALPRIEAGLTSYPKHRSCFSCHHQAVGVFSLTAARTRGFAVDDAFVEKQVAFSLGTFRNRAVVKNGAGVGGDTTSVAYALNAFAAAGRPYDETTEALVEYLLVKQRKDGAWPVPSFGEQRPPTMGGLFTNGGLAVSALKASRPPKGQGGDLPNRIDAAVEKAAAWLLKTEPADNEDRVFRLWGLAAAGADEKHQAAARDELLKRQEKDGGWAQKGKLSPDAYATATALVALRKGGLAADHPAYLAGARYLIREQRPDGAWVVATRAKPLQRFFDNGDAGGKSQFISFAATNWAVVALLETLPQDRTRK